MKNLLSILLVAFALCFMACETCTECSYVITNANGESETIPGNFCSEDSDEVDAFENSFELDAMNAGTTASCER